MLSIHSVTTASSCCFTPISGWTSSVTTATRWLVLTVSHKTRTSSSRWITATLTSHCSSSSSGHDMRPRWILQNPRHRQKSEAATSPVICRWRMESLTWWEASQAQFGATSHCGTCQIVQIQHLRCRPQTVALAVTPAKILSGSQLNHRQFYLQRSTATSTRCGVVHP